MRHLVRIGAVILLLLVGVLVVLGRLGAADPSVALRRTLQKAGYAGVSVETIRAPSDASHVVIEYDPEGQPQAAVVMLSRRAAELAWTRGEIETAKVTVRPRVGPAVELAAAQLASAGSPPARRQRYGEMSSRAGRVVALAVVSVLLTGVLVVLASLAAVSVYRRRRAQGTWQSV